ncbi:hypothetical protein E5288_WYG003180 [Bos mutus]|uniref:Uncharacterized protein n=1 Tax=Bos mutus TaxID=72004 RepID=A0A6B0RBL0_9CETA|nr:hypothetical protein [Bos mutus]
MQAWRLAAPPGLLCPSAGQPAFLFIGAAGGLQAAYRKRCLEKQEAFEAQGVSPNYAAFIRVFPSRNMPVPYTAIDPDGRASTLQLVRSLGRVASEMSIGETSGRSLKGDSRLRAVPLSSGSWAPGPQGRRTGSTRMAQPLGRCSQHGGEQPHVGQTLSSTPLTRARVTASTLRTEDLSKRRMGER